MKLLNRCLILGLMAATTLWATDASAQRRGRQGETKPVTLKKISDRLYEVRGGRGSNGGAYVGDNGVLLIDSKMDAQTVERVLAEIEKITGKPVLYVVNTHSDGDHVRGNQYLPASVKIVSHENCRKEFFHTTRDGGPSEWKDPKLAAFVPSITYRKRMDLHLGGKKVELLYFGVGHTTGDTVVYFPEEKTAFLGDQIFLERVPLIHSYKGGNSFEQVETLRKMLEALPEAERFCSGHSEMTGRAGVEGHVAAMRKRQEKVKALIEKGKGREEILAAFGEDEARLVGVIYNELKPK